MLYADLDDLIVTIMNNSIEPAFFEEMSTASPSPTPTQKPNGLPVWGIILIVLACLLLLIVVIVIVWVACKR